MHVTTRRITAGIQKCCHFTEVITWTELPYVIPCNSEAVDPHHYLVRKLQRENACGTCATAQFPVSRDPSKHKFFAPCQGSAQTISCSACVGEKNGHNEKCRVYSREFAAQEDCVGYLRCNLLESLMQADAFSNCAENRLFIAHGDNYKRCKISQRTTSQRYELVCWQKGGKKRDFGENVRKAFEDELTVYKKTNCSTEFGQDYTENMHEAQNDATIECVFLADEPNDIAFLVPCNQAYEHHKKLSTDKNMDVKKPKLQLENDSESKIPFAYVGTLKDDPTISLLVCRIDLLARVLFDIPEARMTWLDSEDVSGEASCQEIPQVAPLARYAPEWKHDVSFWHDSDVEFDELTYMDVVRDHVGDCVRDVILMNVWTPGGESRTSRCYRQIYQPSGQAVSYHRAHEFQRLLRLKVAHVLNVELR